MFTCIIEQLIIIYTRVEDINIRGCLHESRLSYNQDQNHSVPVETIGDWIIFVYMNQD